MYKVYAKYPNKNVMETRRKIAMAFNNVLVRGLSLMDVILKAITALSADVTDLFATGSIPQTNV